MENNIREKLIELVANIFAVKPLGEHCTCVADSILTHYDVTEKKPREFWIRGTIVYSSEGMAEDYAPTDDQRKEIIHVREIFPESKE